MGIKETAEKGKGAVKNVEMRVAKRFPWLKASLGGLWSVFWLIVALTVEAVIVTIPILLMLAGIVFIIALIVVSDGAGADLLAAAPVGGKSKDKKD